MNNIKETNETIEKNVELRILIIGEAGIGKKSIARRFKLLNCTETKETQFSLKKLEEENDEKSEKNNYYTSSNNFYDTFSDEFEALNQKREEQRLNLMKISKIYKIDLDSIEISFYPCTEAEPLPLDYVPRNDNESNIFEAKNKISLKKLNNEIAQIIMRPLSFHKNHLEVLFLFCFDLSNKNTFNQLKLYYSQINTNFDLKKNYHKILIGNKIDKKNINNEINNSIKKFANETSMKYYEISTFMFFNFENFFEKIFYQIFGGFVNFSVESFKKNFHNILEQKSTFLQSERKIYKTNLNPSPNAYKNNQYEYPKRKRDLVKLFKEKEKYNKKIFINKEGPVFPPLPKKNIFKDNLSELSFENKKDNEKESKKNLNTLFSNELEILENEPIIWDSEKQKKIKEILTPNSRKKGCTLGISVNNSLGLMKNRRENNIKLNLKLSDAIDNGFNLNKKNKHMLKRALSQETYEHKKKEYYKNKLEKMKKNEEDLNERHEKNKKLQNDILEGKNKLCLEKEKKYLNNYIKKQKEKLAKQKKVRKLNFIKSFSRNSIIHKTGFFSPTSTLSKNKGFSFGQKLPMKIKVDSPDYPNLLDDFEKIVYKNSKNINIIKGADRFPKTKSDIYEISESITLDKKFQNFESKRKKFIKNRFVDFFKDRRNKKKLVKLNKINLIKEDENDFNEQILKQYKTTKDYYEREINYNLVENASPQYTIKGKYNYHNSPSSQSYYNSSYDIFETYDDDLDDDDIYNKRKNKYKKDDLLFENPNYSKVKPSYPSFSFGSSERFKAFNSNKNKKGGFIIENDLFQNGIFGLEDHQSFLKAQTLMGTERKFRSYKDNGVPGPGNYKIMNFAEEISKKGEIVNNIRQKINEKNEMENKIRQKIKEKENNKMDNNFEDNNISVKINE